MKENLKNFFKIALIAVYFIAISSLSIVVVEFLSSKVLKGTTLDQMLVYIIVNTALYLLGFALPYVIWKLAFKYKPRISFFKKGEKENNKRIWLNVLWAVIAGITLQFLGMCISGLSTWVVGSNTLTDAFSQFQTSMPITLVAALIALPPAICEELIYRGVIYDTSKKYFSPFTSAIISAIMFGAMHLNMQQLPYAIVLGFALTIIYEKTKSITVTMLIHFIIDFSQMWLVLFEVKTYGEEFAESDANMTWQFAIVLSLFGILFALWNAKVIKHFKDQSLEKEIEE